MKKLLALLMILCLSVCCVSALAESARVPYEFDDFILTTDDTDVVSIPKKDSEIFMQYYPLASLKSSTNPTEALAGMGTNINAVWTSSGGITISGSMLAAVVASQKDMLISSLKAEGMDVTSFEIGEGKDVEYWGFTCAQADYTLTATISGITLTMSVRQIAVPYTSSDYIIFTITGVNYDMDELTEILVNDIQFK